VEKATEARVREPPVQDDRPAVRAAPWTLLAPGLISALPRFSDERRSEVVLGLQRQIGNRSVTRLLEDSDPPPREPVAEPAPEVALAPFTFDAEKFGEDLDALFQRYRIKVHTRAIKALTDVLAPAAERGSVHELWTPLTRLILTADLKAKGVDRLPAELRTPDTIRALAAVEDGERSKVVHELFGVLLAIRDRDAGAEGASSPEAEWAELEPIQKFFGDGKLADYLTVRTNLLGAFGALGDGTAAALKRIRHFYTSEMEDAHLLGASYPVHKTMAKALAQAERKFKAMTRGTPTADFKLSYFGGLNIRPNVNDPSQLSEHAVGAAVDLDAPMNPNERGFPFDLIEDVTGDDLRAGATGKGVDLYNVTASGKRPERLIGYKEALKETSRIKQISDKFREAFQTEDKLAKQMLEIAKRKGAPTVAAKELLDAAILAATEPDAGWAPPAPERAGVPARKAPAPKPAPHHERLAEVTFPRDQVDWVAKRDVIAETVKLLADMYVVFASTVAREDPKRGLASKRPQPRAKGDPENRARVDVKAVDPDLAQLAMHGFMNVPAELAAALVASDGGNLRWLGAGASGTRDYMHFELRAPPKPPVK
jgi:hypothetical protein